ncbi:hypothetical protein MPTK1_7g17450 [Marchantia polymorpha subsp. ruderalis]|uniref:Uncharacterized protein n=2 Tax=Marchantia polymorpha TaxID=3197 RepID=A0AAF6C0S2_MARPO|nr:hypothetical protein MARPO_0051s0082 [Marchantia polymorpha]BBN17856.1 hypothetical protein Mp_7g17450 [Marchantia polymorpha subsp. ruderalis]|eukprot:PTQ38481.1 hypothetical protein MARPO_0051s0082 [Marchantia polymorpha]
MLGRGGECSDRASERARKPTWYSAGSGSSHSQPASPPHPHRISPDLDMRWVIQGAILEILLRSILSGFKEQGTKEVADEYLVLLLMTARDFVYK